MVIRLLSTEFDPLTKAVFLDIYTITIAISILIYIGLGNYAGRGIKRLDDYYVAGRRAPTLLILGTLVASVMSSTMFLRDLASRQSNP